VTPESWLEQTWQEGSRRQERWAEGLSDLTSGSSNRISSAGSELPVSDNRTIAHLSFSRFLSIQVYTTLFSLVFKNITDHSLLHPSISMLSSPPPHFAIGFLYRTFQGSLTVWSVMEAVWHLHTDSLKPIWTRALWKPEALNGSSRNGKIELCSSSAVKI